MLVLYKVDIIIIISLIYEGVKYSNTPNYLEH
jgi:hypothetical protein